jgi:1-phosphatidylinositol phosphodiesterase
LDIRLAVVDNRLISYHGIIDERVPFQDILALLHLFLTSPDSRGETIVMSIKQEDFANTPAITFSRLVHEEILTSEGGMDLWFLDNRIPNLGEVRGKIVMLSRFGDGTGWANGLEGMGIHPSIWPDSRRDGFEWQCKNTLVRTHDWYNIP